ncbi:MAG TPA: cohesin domain-containing protein [Candidatus Paceibacterota bacterium]
MGKIYKISLTILFLGIVPMAARAATLYLSPSSGNYYKSGNFEVRILVNSDMSVNAVSGVLNFPTQHLKIVEINKQNSIVNFWVEEPSFSNAGEFGNMRFEGVVLNPGFIGNGGRVASIVFRADSTGTADLNFTQSSVLANDGFGTNVIATSNGAKFVVLPPKPVQKESPPPPQVIIIKGLEQEKPSGILSFWESLPKWVKASVAISTGISTILILLIVLSFGVIALVWLWANIWHLRDQFIALLRLPVHLFKRFVFRVLNFLGMAEREIKEDLKYSLDQLIKEIKRAPQTPSFRSLIKDWFFLVGDIVKHFFRKSDAGKSIENESVFTISSTEDPSEHKQDLYDANKQNLNGAGKSIRKEREDFSNGREAQ